jgi:membrane associated rhomboid family serine protease
MRQASVGFHCPECTRTSGQRVVTSQHVFGAGAAGAYPVTMVLLALNVAVFVAEAFLRNRATNPVDLFLEGSLFEAARVGDIDGSPDVRGVSEGEWWRVLTSGFLHGGLAHLLFNGFALWSLGRSVEALLGPVRYALVYLASLLWGSFGVLLLTAPNVPTVGASGAVFGLLGVLAALLLARGQNLWQSQLGSMLAINLVITFAVPNISVGGHLGGLAGGLIGGMLLFGLPRRFNGVAPVAQAAPVLTGLAVAGLLGCLVAV